MTPTGNEDALNLFDNRAGGMYNYPPKEDTKAYVFNKHDLDIIRSALIRSAQVDGLIKASNDALRALKIASRMLSEDHRGVLRGKTWGGTDIKNLGEALQNT